MMTKIKHDSRASVPLMSLKYSLFENDYFSRQKHELTLIKLLSKRHCRTYFIGIFVCFISLGIVDCQNTNNTNLCLNSNNP